MNDVRYLATRVGFGGGRSTNLSIIRRYYVDKWSTKIQEVKKQENVEEKVEENK